MARLIQKSGYIQGGRAARYMEYVAKRDGVEVLQSTEPVTKKQMQFLTKLLKDFPDAKELFEYADYLQTPNRGTASAFIVAALDTHLHELESESGYMAYIANRPRAEKRGGHGLFSAEDVTDLKAAKSELETHAGKVWTFIFSLRREDGWSTAMWPAAAPPSSPYWSACGRTRSWTRCTSVWIMTRRVRMLATVCWIPWRIWATMWSVCARRGRTGTMTCGQSGAKRKPRQHKAVGVNSFIQHQLPIQRLLF